MNPFLPLDDCIPDGEPRVFNERVYLYGSHDELGNMDYCSHEYYVYSASIHDLAHWTNHGVTFASKGPNDQVSWSDAILYAPDVIEKDGIYYLYFCLADGSEGVATSYFPEGPFTNAKQMFYPSSINQGKPLEHIDPAVFVDDDGSAYYYWGQFNGQCAKLKDNMYELDAKSYNPSMVTEEEHFFHEGSSMRKIGDTYYFIYCDISTKRANSLAYATSKHPLGPFNYQGVIINNFEADPESWNNHGSIIQIKKKWYIFYHRSTNNSRFSRKACVELIEIDEEGKIKQVEMTSQGFETSLNPYTTILAARACQLRGGNYITQYQKGIHLLVNNKDGCIATFKYLDFKNEHYNMLILELRFRKKVKKGKLSIYLDHDYSQTICSIDLDILKNDSWEDVSVRLNPIYGKRALSIKFVTDSENESVGMLNWFEFRKER